MATKFRNPDAAAAIRDAANAAMINNPNPSDPSCALVRCCRGCEVCNAECVQIQFVDWVGTTLDAGGFALTINPIAYLNGKTFKLKRFSLITRSCAFYLDCPINENIEIAPGLTVHYIRLIISAYIFWGTDGKLKVAFTGAMLADDFSVPATYRHDILFKSPTMDAPASATTAAACYEAVTWQIPDPDVPTDPTPYPDALVTIQVLDGVAPADCVTVGCDGPNGCANCCPGLRCVQIHYERDAFVHPTTFEPWPARSFDVYMARNADDSCAYSGSCILRDEFDEIVGLAWVYAHIVCDDNGNPSITWLRIHNNNTAERWEMFQADAAPIPFSCAGATNLTEANGILYAGIGYPTVPIGGFAVAITLTPLEDCDVSEDCSARTLYNQAKECGESGALVNLWMRVGDPEKPTGVFVIDGPCLEWSSTTSTTPGTLLDPDTITATFPDCAACVCVAGCQTCGSCPEFCPDDGKTFLDLHLELPGGECGTCADYGNLIGEGGCRRCKSCVPIVDPDTGVLTADCFNWIVFSDAECLAHDPPGHIICEPGCEGDGAPSPCTRIVHIGDLHLPLTGYTASTMTFSDSINLGIFGDMDVTVVYNCVSNSYTITIFIDGVGTTNRCKAERIITTADGTGVDCFGIDFGFGIPLVDTVLTSTCTGSGALVSDVEITRNGNC